MKLTKIEYSDLDARQKENFNFQKLSAVLADYGYLTIRLSADWNGADFLALHIHGETLHVQLKGRLTFEKKYLGKNLYIAFSDNGNWYLLPHDEVMNVLLSNKKPDIVNSRSWMELGVYSFPSLSKNIRQTLEPYRILGNASPISES
jgi:hypothetical protein